MLGFHFRGVALTCGGLCSTQRQILPSDFSPVFSSGDTFEMISHKDVVCFFGTSDVLSFHEDFILDVRKISQFLNISGIPSFHQHVNLGA